MGYGPLIRLGESFNGDSNLSTSFVFSDVINPDGYKTEITITVKGSSGDSDNVVVSQFNSISPSNGQFDTEGKELGTITLDGDTEVTKTFEALTARNMKIGLKMADASVETPSYKGSYTINDSIESDTSTVDVSVGGSNEQVQFNDSDSLGGDSSFTFNKTTNKLTFQQVEIGNTISNVTGIIFKDSNRFIHTFKHPTGDIAIPDGKNVNIGIDAGNFTMGATATQTYHASYNINIGGDCGKDLTIGYYNVNIGHQCGANITVGFSNVNIGYDSGLAITIESGNINIGNSAGKSISGAYNNVNIGNLCASFLTSGDENINIGHQAGYLISSGSENICIGSYTGNTLTTGSENVLIGYNVNADAADADYYINIGNQIQAERTPNTIGRFFLFLETDIQLRESFRITQEWAGADAARKASIRLGVSDFNSDNRVCFRMEADGSEALIAFFGVSPKTRRGHIVDADGTLSDITTKFNTLLLNLEQYGLLKTS